MTEAIECYLDLRKEAITEYGMPHARPKHHILSHYLMLYKKYGPLIRLWTMRMESKHSFFKNVVRSSKNFKNVSKTCASRHELAQVSHRYSGLFPRNYLEVPGSFTDLSTVSDLVMKNAIISSLQAPLDTIHLLTYVKVFGTLYSIGDVVIIDKLSHGTLKVGLIQFIALHGREVYFCCSCFRAEQSRYNFYVSTEEMSTAEIVGLKNIHDYFKLKRVGSISSFRFSLHHFISSKS